MRARVIAFTLFVVLCSLVLVGCDSDLCREEAWKTFEDDYVSLSLPPSFKGGNPREPDAMQELRELAALNPDPRWAENMDSYLDGLEKDLSSDEYLHELVMWETPDDDGYFGIVRVYCPPLTDGLLLDGYIDMLVGPLWEERLVTVETLTEDQAFVVLRGCPYEGAPDSLTYYLFRFREPVVYERGPTLYVVEHSFGNPSDEALDDIYRQSALTFAIKGLEKPLDSL